MANTVQSTQSTQSQSQSKSNKNAMDAVETGIKIEYDNVEHGAKPAINVIGRITLNWYAECCLPEVDKAGPEATIVQW